MYNVDLHSPPSRLHGGRPRAYNLNPVLRSSQGRVQSPAAPSQRSTSRVTRVTVHVYPGTPPGYSSIPS
eukprot:62440-Rhodomonas_salina.1